MPIFFTNKQTCEKVFLIEIECLKSLLKQEGSNEEERKKTVESYKLLFTLKLNLRFEISKFFFAVYKRRRD